MASPDSAFLWESEVLRSARRPSRPPIAKDDVTSDASKDRADPEPKEVDLTTDDVSPEVPEGSMLVPLDAWNRMLNQLGNLHEAGQQLAEARERAAKAETEALFLKERLSELRDQLDEHERDTDETAAEDSSGSIHGFQSATSLIRKVYSDWRQRRRS